MNALVRNLLFALLAVGAIATAGGQAPGPEPATPKESAPAQKAADAPAVEVAPTPKPTPTADAEEQLEEFVPTEKVPADEAVAFPVDI